MACSRVTFTFTLVSVDHNIMAVHLTGSYCKSSAVDGIDDMLWNSITEVGNVRSECEEDNGTYCEDGDSAVSGKGAWNVTCFVY
jgi:hypothetical protein